MLNPPQLVARATPQLNTHNNTRRNGVRRAEGPSSVVHVCFAAFSYQSIALLVVYIHATAKMVHAGWNYYERALVICEWVFVFLILRAPPFFLFFVDVDGGSINLKHLT